MPKFDDFIFNDNALMGEERATRNSDGGDREHGLFGEAQSTFVTALNDGTYDAQFPVDSPAGTHYGQLLQDYFF